MDGTELRGIAWFLVQIVFVSLTAGVFVVVVVFWAYFMKLYLEGVWKYLKRGHHGRQGGRKNT